MVKFNRRALMASGTAFVAGGTVGSLSAAADDEESGDEASEREEPDGWSSYYGTPGNTGSVAANGAFPEPETVAWEYDESGHAVVADGRVYLRSGDEVHALEDGDGSVVWTANGLEADDDNAYATPAVADGTVVLGGEGLTALGADSGAVRWSRTFDLEDEEGVTSPTVAFDTAFVVADGTLHAVDVADGSERWSRDAVELEASEESDSADSREVAFASTPVAVADEFVYAGVGHDEGVGFVAVAVATGETQWTHTVDSWDGVDTWTYTQNVQATADRVLTGTGSHAVTYPHLDPQTGEQVDVQEGYFYTRVATNDVLVTTGDFGFSVRNYETDDTWREEDSPTGAWHPPAIAGETLVIPCDTAGGIEEKDGVYGFDLEDGTERWQFTHPDVDVGDVSGGFIVSGETIYVLGGDRLQALRPETEEPEEEEPEDEPEDESEDEGQEGEDELEDEEPEDDDPEDDDPDETPADGSADDADDSTEEVDDESTEPADEADGADDTESEANEGDAADGADPSGDDSDDDAAGTTDDDADGTPGFTTGAGILGGALGLEWLRRRSDATDSSEERSSDER